MKKLLFTTLLLIGCFAFTFGQIEEAKKPMSMGVETAYNIVIPGAKAKDVEKIWKDYIKKYRGKTKKSRKTGETLTDDATIPELSANSIDVYVKTNEVNGEVLFSVWFDVGGGFLSSETHPDKTSSAQKIVLLFAIEVSKHMTQDELKGEQKTLGKLEKELQKLEKQNLKLHEDIEAFKQKIMEAEAAIEQNKLDQENKKIEITNQTEKVGTVKKKLEELDN